jgi:hypothetical protein
MKQNRIWDRGKLFHLWVIGLFCCLLFSTNGKAELPCTEPLSVHFNYEQNSVVNASSLQLAWSYNCGKSHYLGVDLYFDSVKVLEFRHPQGDLIAKQELPQQVQIPNLAKNQGDQINFTVMVLDYTSAMNPLSGQLEYVPIPLQFTLLLEYGGENTTQSYNPTDAKILKWIKGWVENPNFPYYLIGVMSLLIGFIIWRKYTAKKAEKEMIEGIQQMFSYSTSLGHPVVNDRIRKMIAIFGLGCVVVFLIVIIANPPPNFLSLSPVGKRVLIFLSAMLLILTLAIVLSGRPIQKRNPQLMGSRNSFFYSLGLGTFIALVVMIGWFLGERLGITPYLTLLPMESLTPGENYILFCAIGIILCTIGVILIGAMTRAVTERHYSLGTRYVRSIHEVTDYSRQKVFGILVIIAVSMAIMVHWDTKIPWVPTSITLLQTLLIFTCVSVLGRQLQYLFLQKTPSSSKRPPTSQIVDNIALTPAEFLEMTHSKAYHFAIYPQDPQDSLFASFATAEVSERNSYFDAFNTIISLANRDPDPALVTPEIFSRVCALAKRLKGDDQVIQKITLIVWYLSRYMQNSNTLDRIPPFADIFSPTFGTPKETDLNLYRIVEEHIRNFSPVPLDKFEAALFQIFGIVYNLSAPAVIQKWKSRINNLQKYESFQIHSFCPESDIGELEQSFCHDICQEYEKAISNLNQTITTKDHQLLLEIATEAGKICFKFAQNFQDLSIIPIFAVFHAALTQGLTLDLEDVMIAAKDKNSPEDYYLQYFNDFCPIVGLPPARTVSDYLKWLQKSQGLDSALCDLAMQIATDLQSLGLGSTNWKIFGVAVLGILAKRTQCNHFLIQDIIENSTYEIPSVIRVLQPYVNRNQLRKSYGTISNSSTGTKLREGWFNRISVRVTGFFNRIKYIFASTPYLLNRFGAIVKYLHQIDPTLQNAENLHHKAMESIKKPGLAIKYALPQLLLCCGLIIGCILYPLPVPFLSESIIFLIGIWFGLLVFHLIEIFTFDKELLQSFDQIRLLRNRNEIGDIALQQIRDFEFLMDFMNLWDALKMRYYHIATYQKDYFIYLKLLKSHPMTKSGYFLKAVFWCGGGLGMLILQPYLLSVNYIAALFMLVLGGVMIYRLVMLTSIGASLAEKLYLAKHQRELRSMQRQLKEQQLMEKYEYLLSNDISQGSN